MDFETQIFKALGYLFIAGVIYMAWKLSFDAARMKSFYSVLLQGVMWCLVIALIGSVYLGTHTGDCEDDPLRGTCETVQDFTPTLPEREAVFIYYLVLLVPSVLLGALQGSGRVRHNVPIFSDSQR